MAHEEIQILAQQLVNAKLEIKRLEERIFNQEKLPLLLQDLHLSQEQITNIFDNSKVQRTRDTTIHIILDR